MARVTLDLAGWQAKRALPPTNVATIKTATAAAASIPALKTVVAQLADELQRLADRQ